MQDSVRLSLVEAVLLLRGAAGAWGSHLHACNQQDNTVSKVQGAEPQEET